MMPGSSLSFPRPRTFDRMRVSSSNSFTTRSAAKWALVLAFVNIGTISEAEISSCSDVDILTSAPTCVKQYLDIWMYSKLCIIIVIH